MQSFIFDLPIYQFKIHMVISNDILAARRGYKSLFGECLMVSQPKALCSTADEDIGLFFTYDNLEPELLAHEIFHATIRILDKRGIKFDVDNHEAYAYLNGYITEWVYKTLKGNDLIMYVM